MSAPGRDSLRRCLLWGGLVIVAVAIVFWNANPRMLDPTDATWINVDDPLAHVMGWEQFRASPLLQYPIARNDGYGLERSSSLVYSDSIPIAALVLRPFSALLPHPFQYLGLWTVLSLVLQGYWGARLLRLRSDRTSVAVIGAGFFLVAPILLRRIGIHTALTSHWLLLCALWLYFSSREAQARRWALLLLLAVGIHAYLFVMVAAIWAANLVKCRIARTLGRRDLVHAVAIIVAVIAWMHCLGYFVIGKGAAAGGGMTRVDLVNFVAGWSWTTLLPVIHGDPDPNAWDGYAYLGAGLMAVLVASAAAALLRWARRARPPGTAPAPGAAGHVEVSWIPLVVVACGFLVFSATSEVVFAGHKILSYPWPRFMRPIAATFRGGGRMIWLTYYVLVLAMLWFAIQSWPRRTLIWLFGVGLVVQVIDLREGARVMRAAGSQPGLIEPLRDPVWDMIKVRYRKLVSIPAFHGQPDRHALGWFCAVNGIDSNIGHFGRIDQQRQEQGARRALEQVLTGTYDPATAYSFPSPEIWNIAKRAASPHDLAIVADGHHLLLPGADPGGTVKPADDVAAPPLDTWLSFAAGGVAAGYLLDGWSWREPWGTWSDGKTGSFLVPVPPGHRGTLRVSLRWLGHADKGLRQRVTIVFEQTEFRVEFRGDVIEQEDTFDVVPVHDWIVVRTRIWRPIAADKGRPLGLGLVAMRLSIPPIPVPENHQP